MSSNKGDKNGMYLVFRTQVCQMKMQVKNDVKFTHFCREKEKQLGIFALIKFDFSNDHGKKSAITNLRINQIIY